LNVPDYQVEVVSLDGSDQLTTNRGVKLAGAVPRDSVSGPIDTLVIAGGPGSESENMIPTISAGSPMLLTARVASRQSIPERFYLPLLALSMVRER
jgi:hypothetical protein